MLWNNKRYHSLSYELKNIFGEKVFKLSLNGGFTCPNRDGTIGNKGCLFCSEKGSGEFAGSSSLDIKHQIQQQKKLLKKKWPKGKYIAYFQNYTNTYSSVGDLKKKYYSALDCQDVVGLAIATRPDCLGQDIIELLDEINKKTYLWLELGLQTIHNSTAKLIKRGYDHNVFDSSVNLLKNHNIKTVAHIIFGLPGENKKDMIDTVKYISHKEIWGIKMHLLYILYNSNLYNYYMKKPFHIMTKEEYVDVIVDAIEILPPDTVIHRLTGDAPHSKLFEPQWSKNKWDVLNSINRELSLRNSYQGCKKQY